MYGPVSPASPPYVRTCQTSFTALCTDLSDQLHRPMYGPVSPASPPYVRTCRTSFTALCTDLSDQLHRPMYGPIRPASLPYVWTCQSSFTALCTDLSDQLHRPMYVLYIVMFQPAPHPPTYLFSSPTHLVFSQEEQDVLDIHVACSSHGSHLSSLHYLRQRTGERESRKSCEAVLWVGNKLHMQCL